MTKLRARMARLAARVAAVCARIRASPWLGVLGKLAAIAFALGVLAWIGRPATAGNLAPPPAAVASTMTEVDASSETTLDAAAIPSAPVTAAPSTATSPPSHSRASPVDPVYLNLADEAELRRLPGVGAKRAAAILALRARVGRFARVEDLLRVKGVGRTTLKKWRPLVRLDATRASPDAGST